MEWTIGFIQVLRIIQCSKSAKHLIFKILIFMKMCENDYHANFNDDDNQYVINECQKRKYGRKYPLPQLETTFPSKRNPFDKHSKIKEWTFWNFESSLMHWDKFSSLEGVTIFTSYFYPFCADLDRYENLVKYMVQFFVFDDHTEADWGNVARNIQESQKIWGQLENALDKLLFNESTPMNNWKPYVFAMYSVFDNIFSQFNYVQKRRSVEAWKNYIQGNLEETEALNSGIMFTDVQQMIKIRIKSIGFRPSVQFIEYADNIFITEEDWNDPRLQRLFDLVSEIFVYVNDFFSFEKEFIQQNRDLSQMFNLVALISQLHDIPIAMALERLADMTRDMERRIRDSEDEIMNDPDCSQLKKTFIKRINYFIGGNHKVSTFLDRYNKFIN